MLQHRGNGTRPCSSLPSKQTTQGKGGGTATNRQTLRIDVTQLTTARNAIRCRRQSSSKETSRSFIQSDQRGKNRSSKREATTATHTHTDNNYSPKQKKQPHWHNSARQKKNFTSTATSEARPRPTTRLLPCCHANHDYPLTDRYLSRRYRILSQRAHSRGEGLLYHAKKSSIYHKRAPKQTVFFVCLPTFP